MKSATVAQAAKHFGVDPATVRRWASQGCPTVRKGRRGPGHGAQLDLDAVATWRGRAGGSVGLTPHEALQRIAVALQETITKDHVDIRAGISREDAAAVLIVAFERCGKTFGHTYRFDEQPVAIRALMRVL